jgi:hypothetical protein
MLAFDFLAFQAYGVRQLDYLNGASEDQLSGNCKMQIEVSETVSCGS